MKKVAVAIAVVSIFVFSAGTAVAINYLSDNKLGISTQKRIYTPEELLAEANKLRAEKGIPPLELDERLNKSAQLKADDMKAGGYYNHVDPETGKHGYTYIDDVAGNACKDTGENIDGSAIGTSPFDPTYGWPSSKLHYGAEIDTRYDLTGFGYVEFGGYAHYVQHFCDLR